MASFYVVFVLLSLTSALLTHEVAAGKVGELDVNDILGLSRPLEVVDEKASVVRSKASARRMLPVAGRETVRAISLDYDVERCFKVVPLEHELHMNYPSLSGATGPYFNVSTCQVKDLTPALTGEGTGRKNKGKTTETERTLRLVLETRGGADEVAARESLKKIFGAGRVVVGTRTWGCHRAGQHSLIDVVTSAAPKVKFLRPGLIEVEFRSRQGSYHNVFRNAKVRFETGHFADPRVPLTALPGGKIRLKHDGAIRRLSADEFPADSKRRVGSLWSWFWGGAKKAWGYAKHIAQDAENAAADAYHFAQAGATGTVTGSVQASNSFGWNYDPATDAATKPIIVEAYEFSLNCWNCFVDLDVTVSLSLDVENYQMTSFSSGISGDAQIAVNALMTLNQAMTFSGSKDLPTVDGPIIPLTIGPIPFVMHPQVPIEIDYSVTVQAGMQAQLNASVSGQVSYLAEYAASNPGDGWNYVNDHSWQHKGFGKVYHADFLLHVGPVPTFLLMIDHIGGPFVRLKPALEMLMQEDGVCATTEGPSYWTGTLNYVFQASIGAELHIELGGFNIIGPYEKSETFYSAKRRLASGCFDYGGQKRNLLLGAGAPVPPAPGSAGGTSLSGSFGPPGCFYGWGEISVQILGLDEQMGIMTVVVVYNTAHFPPAGLAHGCPDQACVTQAEFSGSLNNPASGCTESGQWYFEPITYGNGTEVLFNKCVAESCSFKSVPFCAAISSDWSQWNIPIYDHFDTCNPTVLNV